MDNNTNDIYNIDFDELGSVKISSEVVAAVASLAAREVRGIADMGNSAGVLGDLLGKKTYKGVRCEIKDKTTSIDMFVIVEYGTNIPKACNQLQEKVKTSVETMTGLEVKSVNVYVQAIEIPETQE